MSARATGGIGSIADEEMERKRETGQRESERGGEGEAFSLSAEKLKLLDCVDSCVDW